MLRAPGQATMRDVGFLDYSFGPVLSHDGSMTAFGDASFEGGPNYSVMLRKTDGGRATRLGEGFPLDFSRDGRSLLAIVTSRPYREGSGI